MITSKTFYPTIGSTFLEAGEIAGVTILRLCREGTGFDPTTGAVGNRQYVYSNYGRVDFLDPFAGNPANDVGRERIFIKYKY